MKIARMILMVILMASWAAAQSAAPAAADDKGKTDSAAAEHKHGEQAGMSCGCCKDMAKMDGMKADMKADAKDASKAGEKSAAKSEAPKSEGMTAGGGMGCCAKMGKDKQAAGGMSCGSKKDDAVKTETLPAEKMK